MKFLQLNNKKIFDDTGILIITTLCIFTILVLINHTYGFHQDELAFLDDGKHLAWGYVESPPFTPFLAFTALKLFGLSLFGVRLFAAIAVSLVMLLTGLITRELGGTRKVQIISAFAALTSPVLLFFASFFSYTTFDYLWWVLTAYMLIKLLKSENPRWWIGIGLVIGLGVLTKYTILVLATGIAIGIIVTPARRYLKSPWLWGGVVLSLVIFLPNVIWQIQHHFISLKFLKSIHSRDIHEGRTAGFLPQQFDNTSIAALLFWIAGLYFYLFSPSGKRYRLIGIVYLVSFTILFLTQGRQYYAAPLYPMLIAAGAVFITSRISPLLKAILYRFTIIVGIVMILIMLPLGTVNSSWWKFSASKNIQLRDEIGWPDLVTTVDKIYSSLSEKEKNNTGILAANYGIAGAIDLYGQQYGLPEVISGVNSYWLRGYPKPSPKILIVVGVPSKTIEKQKIFTKCRLAGHVTNKFGVMNDEALSNPDIYICSNPIKPWSEFWNSLQSFQ